MTIDDGDEGCTDPSSSEVFPADDPLFGGVDIVFGVGASNSCYLMLGGSLLLIVAVNIIIIVGEASDNRCYYGLWGF